MKTAAAARFKQAEFEIVPYVLTVEDSTTQADLLKADFWANISMRLRPWDIIHVRPDNGSWYSQLIVRDAGRLWAKVAPILHIEFTDAKAPVESAELDGHEIKFRGPHLRWSVIRSSDHAVVKESLGSKVEAFAWLAEHLKTLAA